MSQHLRYRRRVTRHLAATLALFSLAAPAALAMPIDPPGHARAQTSETDSAYVARPLANRTPSHAPIVITRLIHEHQSFDWGSAGIGGGFVAASAVALFVGLAYMPRHRVTRPLS